MRMELSNSKQINLRYTNSLWEIAGIVGGFSVFAIFAFKFIYKLVKSNSIYVLN